MAVVRDAREAAQAALNDGSKVPIKSGGPSKAPCAMRRYRAVVLAQHGMECCADPGKVTQSM